MGKGILPIAVSLRIAGWQFATDSGASVGANIVGPFTGAITVDDGNGWHG